MKKIFLLLLVPLLLTGCQTKQTTEETINNKITVYAYDSLTAEWGLLPAILEDFKTQYNAEVDVVSFADNGTMLSQLILEKDNPKADVVIGLDNVNFSKVKENELLATYQSQAADEIPLDLWFDDNYTMTPFDYGYAGFVYDSEKINFTEPISLMDLTKEEYKDKIIIEQAGLSSPGTQLMLWTKAALSEDDYNKFWEGMAENVLTVAPDWSTAYYTLFTEGEAPIVLSYLTSPAYHIDQEQVTKYKAIPIKEGYIRQVEGVGIVNGASNTEYAQKFVDFMLSDEAQTAVFTTQWMFPVLGHNTTWPDAYQQIIIPKEEEILIISKEDLANKLEDWTNEWKAFFKI